MLLFSIVYTSAKCLVNRNMHMHRRDIASLLALHCFFFLHMLELLSRRLTKRTPMDYSLTFLGTPLIHLSYANLKKGDHGRRNRSYYCTNLIKDSLKVVH